MANKKPKKTTKKEKEVKEVSEFIILSNAYLRRILMRDMSTGRHADQVVQAFKDKEKPFKFEYWLTRCFDAIESEIKSFDKTQTKILEKYATKYEEDIKGEEGEKDKGKGEFEKDDNNNYVYTEENRELKDKEFMEFLETEIELPMKKIIVNINDPKLPDFSTNEMALLLPLMREIEQP